MVQHLILITGMPGAGKTSLAKLFKENGYQIMSMGDVIRDLAYERGLEPSSSVLGNLAKEIRSQGGDAAVADRCVEKIRKLRIDRIVIDGIRSIAEVKAFKSQFKSYLVAIFASTNTRYLRLLSRNRRDAPLDRETFDDRDLRELGFSMGYAIALSDYLIVNEASISDLREEFHRLLEWIGKNE